MLEYMSCVYDNQRHADAPAKRKMPAYSHKRQLIDNGDGTHSVPTQLDGVHGLIDSQYAEIVGQFNWNAKQSYHNVYILTTLPQKYCVAGERRKNILLHHLIAGRPIGDLQTDHINFDSLDNRATNLRTVTPQENLEHRRKPTQPRRGER